MDKIVLICCWTCGCLCKRGGNADVQHILTLEQGFMSSYQFLSYIVPDLVIKGLFYPENKIYFVDLLGGDYTNYLKWNI